MAQVKISIIMKDCDEEFCLSHILIDTIEYEDLLEAINFNKEFPDSEWITSIKRAIIELSKGYFGSLHCAVAVVQDN